VEQNNVEISQSVVGGINFSKLGFVVVVVVCLFGNFGKKANIISSCHI
jgi:hypothetical protein